MQDGAGAGSVRLFIALNLPDAVKASLARAQAALRSTLTRARITWSRSEQLHLTLKFLGTVPADRVTPLTHVLRNICQKAKPMRFRATSVGFFPAERLPRVIWAGLEGELEPLAHLHQLIQEATADFTSERAEGRFSAHITLGRVKLIPMPEVELLVQSAARMAQNHFGDWTAQSLDLMRSELLPSGPRHTQLATLPFAQAPPEFSTPPTGGEGHNRGSNRH